MIEQIRQGNMDFVFSRNQRKPAGRGKRLRAQTLRLLSAQYSVQVRLIAVDRLSRGGENGRFQRQPIAQLVFGDRANQRCLWLTKAKQVVDRAPVILPTKNSGL